MDEVRATYYETNAERANLKNSANHKRNGASANGMKNPRMSNKEIEEKHGECEKYKLSRFMSYEEFQKMRSDLQIEYLNKLQDKYDVGLYQINKEVFENDGNLLFGYLKMKDILKDCHPEKKRAKTGLLQLRDDFARQKREDNFEKSIDISQIPETKGDLPKFMTYDEAKKLSNEDLVRFVNRILDSYEYVGIRTINMLLFGFTGNSQLKELIERRKLQKQIHKHSRKAPTRGKAYEECVARFKNDISLWKKETEPVEVATQESKVAKTFPKVRFEEVSGFENTYVCHKEGEGVSEEKSVETKVPDISVTEPKQELFLDPINGTAFYSNTETIKQTIKELEQKLQETGKVSFQPESSEDPMLYHDASFTSSYIGIGIDKNEINGAITMFEGKRIRFEMRITML